MVTGLAPSPWARMAASWSSEAPAKPAPVDVVVPGLQLGVGCWDSSAPPPWPWRHLEDHIGHPFADDLPHLLELLAAFDGILALRVRLVAAQRTLHDRVLQVVHLQEMVLPPLVVDPQQHPPLQLGQLPAGQLLGRR